MGMEPFRPEEQTSERSLGALFRQLSSDLGTLMRQESELARAEIRAKASKLGASVAELGAGGLVGFAGFLVLLQAAVHALTGPLDSAALAALVVGGVTLIVGLLLLARGRSHLKADELTPTRTIESLRKDAALATDPGRQHPA
jgi:hypothetical protein